MVVCVLEHVMNVGTCVAVKFIVVLSLLRLFWLCYSNGCMHGLFLHYQYSDVFN